jgi:pyridoxine 4-dehydrogenase
LSIEPTLSIGAHVVRRLGFGAMGLSSAPLDRERSMAVARRALELVDLVDTAFMYGWGGNEALLAEALRPYPARLLLATKIGIVAPRPGEWAVCGRPDVLREQAENALRRLHLERIELLQLHRLDPDVPLAEQLGLLAELRREGKVAHVGLSEIARSELVEASSVLPIASVQNRYSVYDRRAEPVLEECEARGIAFLPWRPVATGETTPMTELVDRIARARGATRAQIALAWLLHRSPVIAPIPGTTTIAHLEENVAAAALSLDDEELARLDAAP